MKITIDVNENIASYLADILCWLNGYLEGRDGDNKLYFLEEAVDYVRILNMLLKRALQEKKNQ